MTNGKYVDGFVLAVPKEKCEQYKKDATFGRDIWMKHGALDYYECKEDDMTQQEMEEGKTRSFREMANAKDDEEVWFSFIVFKSKEHRDSVNAKVMEEMKAESKDEAWCMPFEMNRMAYGGFKVLVGKQDE